MQCAEGQVAVGEMLAFLSAALRWRWLRRAVAHHTIRVGRHMHGAPFHVFGIKQHQAAIQALADVGDELQGFGCLHGADDAYQG